MADDRRLATLRANLGFLQLEPLAPELQRLHRGHNPWTDVGLVTVGDPAPAHRWNRLA